MSSPSSFFPPRVQLAANPSSRRYFGIPENCGTTATDVAYGNMESFAIHLQYRNVNANTNFLVTK
ncbi:hypothetical protein PM082_015029 [Marasmius tenuissimus]|nr:hypothetical protein PM082_015029 [Marasmius tenuissimus]